MYDNTFKGKIPYISTTNKFKFVRGRRGLKEFFSVINSKDISDELNYKFLV